MQGELIAIGDELTSGRVLNTTSRFAAAQLFAVGHQLLAMTTIGDDPGLIGRSLHLALSRADFVVVTGGLGPTSDDLTNQAVASALDRPATFYPEVLRKIRQHCHCSADVGAQALEKLAWLPAGAHDLHSEMKSAGYFLVQDGKPVFFLPGVPEEMEELMREAVLSRLSVWDGKKVGSVRQRLYRLTGLAEVEINQRLASLEKSDPRLRIGYYPVFPEVELSLGVFADDADANAEEEAEALFQRATAEVEALFAEAIYGRDHETLEGVLGALLTRQGKSLALAESCTGGLIGERLTQVAGSSDYFLGGVVVYSNTLKEKLLGVSPEILEVYGAVSRECAAAMAEGVRQLSGADYGLAVTGIAGPGGGSPEKPVGTVHFGLASSGETLVFSKLFPGDRGRIRALAGQTGLDLIRRHLCGHLDLT